MNTWMWEMATFKKYLFAPVVWVVMRRLRCFPHPPQAAQTVGANALTDTAEVAIAALPAVTCFIKGLEALGDGMIPKTARATTGIHLRDLPFSALVGKAETST